MALKWGWLVAAGLPLVLIGGAPAVGLAAAAEQKVQPSARAEKAAQEAPAASGKPAATAQPAGLVGKIIAVCARPSTPGTTKPS
jgi:hypothetical protein